MDTDTHCPSCHSSAARATAAAPGRVGEKDDGLLKMLPMFGGAAGGLIYGAIKAAEASCEPTARRPFGGASAAARRGSGGASLGKVLFGLVFLLGGGLLIFAGGREAWDTREVSRRPATEVTAAELSQPDFAGSAPEWIRFQFTESKPTAVALKRKRRGGGLEADARCLLVRVENKWLVATVPPDFQGNELTGYLVPIDPTASRPMLEQIAKAQPKVTTILPFEFNGVEGSASDQRLRNSGAAILGFVGLVGVLLGVYFLPFRSRSAVTAGDPLGRAV
jgi:hypothetical protein